MLIKQLSIFLENRKGRFTEVAKILGEAGINMSAFTVSENSDFGILRLIVSDTDKAIEILRNQKYAVSITDVVCLHCPNEPGALAKVMDIITGAGIFVEYMYAFLGGKSVDHAYMIFRVADEATATAALAARGIQTLEQDAIASL